MKTLLLLFISTSAFATCMMRTISCEPANNAQNIYQIETVSCAAPGGPVNRTQTLIIKNLMLASCSAINCTEKLFEAQINTDSRSRYFDAQINTQLDSPVLYILDRRKLPQGQKQIKLLNNELVLEGYTCINRRF